MSPFLSSSEAKVVATFLTLDVYFTNSFLCHCTDIQDPAPYAENVYIKKSVGFFTALLSSCYVEMSVVSVRERGFFSFALRQFPCNSGSLLNDDCQLLDRLCSPGAGCRAVGERCLSRLALGGGMSSLRRNLLQTHKDVGLPCK